jgi:hypothetical protein
MNTGRSPLSRGHNADSSLVAIAEGGAAQGSNVTVQTTVYPTTGEWRWHVLVDGAGFAHGTAPSRAAASRHARDYLNRRCRNCGCTLTHACPGGCYWLEPNLCSACA